MVVVACWKQQSGDDEGVWAKERKGPDDRQFGQILCIVMSKQTNYRAFEPSPQRQCLYHLVSALRLEVGMLAMAQDEKRH